MARGEWEEARGHLSVALSGFMESPERYGQKRLIPRVKVAAGIAGALAMEYARLPRAAELLVQGMRGGARVPRALLRDVLDALDEAGSNSPATHGRLLTPEQEGRGGVTEPQFSPVH